MLGHEFFQSFGGLICKDQTRNCALVCVCVCVQPWTKGFSPPLLLSYMSRGMERTCEAPSNEAPHMILGYRQGRLPTYLLVLSQAVTPIFRFWFMVLHVFHPINTRPQQLRRRFDCCRLCDNNVKPFKCSDPCTFLFFHLPSQRDLR